MPRRDIRMSLFAMIDGRVEVGDAFLCMRIVLCRLGRLCMFKSSLGMGHEDVRMSLFTVINRFFGMAYGLGQVIFREGKTRGHQNGGSKTKDQSESSAVHDVSPYFHASNRVGLGALISSASM
jgi:hypothetical protein